VPGLRPCRRHTYSRTSGHSFRNSPALNSSTPRRNFPDLPRGLLMHDTIRASPQPLSSNEYPGDGPSIGDNRNLTSGPPANPDIPRDAVAYIKTG